MSRGGPANLLVVIIPLGIANHTVLAGSRVLVSLNALSLGATPFTIGLLMALYALLPMFCAVAAGRLTDRIGARKPMLAGSIGVTLGVAAPLVWPGLPALFFGAVVVGLSFMVFQIATQRTTGDVGGPHDRARNFSLLGMGYSASGFIGPLIAGVSIDHFGFRTTFAVLAVVSSVPAVILAANRFKFPRPQPTTPTLYKGGVRELLRHRPLRQIFVVNMLLSAGWDLHTVFIPIYGARLGLTASEIGIVLAAFAAATFLVRLMMPAIARRHPEHRILTAALLAAGIVYMAFPFAHSTLMLSLLSFALGLGLGSGQPVVMSLLHLHTPAGRIGEAVGMRMSLVQTSSVVVPLLFGAVGSSLGLAPVFWTIGGCLTAGGYLTRTRRRQ